jgi:hypothetical protein
MALWKDVTQAYINAGGNTRREDLGQAVLSRLAFWNEALGDKEMIAISADDIDAALAQLASRGRLKGGKMATTATGKPLAGSTLCQRGLMVKSIVGTVLADPRASQAACVSTPPSGAAYVVISHGEGGGSAYLSSGVPQPLTGDEGVEELHNANGQPQAVGGYYVDDGIGSSPHFADIVVRSSVASVATKAGLGTRTHS